MTARDRSRKKELAMAAIRAVEGILRRWDPLGVTVDKASPGNEYNFYAPHIVSMLAKGTTVDDLAAYLERIRTVTIGLPPDREKDLHCAAELSESWRQRDEKG
jgi:hypothetical protein